MSGMLYYNFREGDRSEYLANYLLSGIGLVTPVPRQEDIGFDFYCQLSDQENQHLTFGFPFIIQIKSSSVKSIIHGSEDQSKWKKDQIDWLKRLEIPLLFGFINKKEMKLDIYNCSPLRYILTSGLEPSMLEFMPRVSRDESEIHFPKFEKIEAWNDATKGNGYKHTIDMGNSIITLTNDDIYDKDLLKYKKELLRRVITMEQYNILFSRLKLPYFNWTKTIQTDVDHQGAWFHADFVNESLIKNLFNSNAPALISIAINLSKNNRTYLMTAFKQILNEISPELIPEEIRVNFPQLFDDAPK